MKEIEIGQFRYNLSKFDMRDILWMSAYFYKIRNFSKSMVKNEVVKGCSDSTSDIQIRLNKIQDTIRKNFELFGFRPFDTPIIEYFSTLAGKYDEDSEIVGEIYKVSDRGERKLGLRYDLTVPMCRYVASQTQLKLPFKRYAIAKSFRDGPIKVGRSREFIQCDADVVGIAGTDIEAETLSMFYSTYTELGIDAVLEINNNKILRGAFLQFGFDEKELESVILSVDKLKKIGRDAVLDEIAGKGLSSSEASKAIDILSCKSYDGISKLAENELLKEGIEELNKLVKSLDLFEVNYRINYSMSRGLNIYTGSIWEMYDKSGKVKSSIGSGGRYDKVIGEFADNGKEYPTVGVSFGLVPIAICLENKNEKSEISLTEIVVAPLDAELIVDAQLVAMSLRKQGLKTEVCYDYKLKKAFSYSEFVTAKKLVILGKKDVEAGVYTLRDLETKEEEKVSFSF
ncbi:MAG: histidine--tRNA ligase [Nanoarchaeales archaeon]|nr:histidine--tRNA ligase [Nanoarchaeales archaeon]